MSKHSFIDKELEQRNSHNLLRRLQNIKPVSGVEVEVEGRQMLNFCSNDYLGLAKHPIINQRSIEYTKKYGTGSTASRLVSGNFECFEREESKLAKLLIRDSSLIFNSGFQANVSLIPALADRKTLIFSDQLNHNSLVQGSILSRCHVESFQHNDMDHLKDILKRSMDQDCSRKIIVTESVFSMDGDQCDISTLVDLSNKYRALLFVDEAHAIGLLGDDGLGLTYGKDVDIIMGTFSKAFGSFGAYVACDERMREYFVNFCYGLIYTTALPPGVLGAIDAALDLVPEMEKERRDIKLKSEALRSELNRIGFNTGKSSTHIIPVIIGNEKETLDLSKWLEDNGILAITFRPPTVNEGECRIRLSLTVMHSDEHINRLIDLLEQWAANGAF